MWNSARTAEVFQGKLQPEKSVTRLKYEWRSVHYNVIFDRRLTRKVDDVCVFVCTYTHHLLQIKLSKNVFYSINFHSDAS